MSDTDKLSAGRKVALFMLPYRNDNAIPSERYANICTLIWNIVVAMKDGRDYLKEQNISIPNTSKSHD